MGTFFSKILSVQTHTSTVGEWYSYIDTGTGPTDAANYTPGNAAIIANLRSISAGGRYVVYSVVLKGSGGFPVFPAAPGEGVISFLLDLDNVVTDIGTLKGYQLPLGFRVLTANLKQIGTNATTDSPGGTHIQRDGQDIQNYIPDLGHSSTVVLVINADTPLSVLGSSYGAHFVSTGSGGFSFAFLTAGSGNGLNVEGTYSIVSYTWGISNGNAYTVPGTSITGKVFGPSDRINITSANGILTDVYNAITNPTGTGPDFLGSVGGGSGALSVSFVWTGGSLSVVNTDFDDWTSILISFLLPGGLPTGTDISVTVESDGFPIIPSAPPGTQFSGSVKLGVIKILTTQASGIYKIVANQTHDVVYTDNPNSNTTANFAIPNPHIKTGFIGG